jgi:hypothetical protein
LQVVAPRGARKAVEKALPVDLHCDEVPADPDVQVLHPQGLADKEAILVVRHAAVDGKNRGQTLVTCDALLNLSSKTTKFPFTFLLAPIDRPSTPRLIRWMMLKDTKAWQAQLEQLAATTTRIIPGHGALVTEDAAGALRSVAGLLN